MLPLSRRVTLVPWSLAHDGRSFFASVFTAAWSGVVRVDAPSGHMSRIRRFPNPMTDQADGAFDGRWLVWNEYHSLTDFNDFTTWAWDSRSGRLEQIGATTRAPDGTFWVSPWREPDSRDGIATWVQGSGPDAMQDLHVYDLATGHDSVPHRGMFEGSFMLDGPLVAWPEAPKAGATTQIHTFDPVAGNDVATPPALRTLRNVHGLYSNGSVIAYPDAAYKSLWIAPSLAAAPRLVVAARGADTVDNSVRVGSRYVGFGIQPRTFLADAKLGRYVQISNGGWTRVDDRTLILLRATASKAHYAKPNIVFVPLRKLPPIPACS